ncbi:MAG: hypothetical protein ACQKBY_05680, partial [Verrucomicrobiales bacterium]
MNVTTIVLGLISLILAVAFFFSMGGLKKESADGQSQEEIAEIKAQIAALNAEAEALREQSPRYQNLPAVTDTPAPVSTPSAADLLPDSSGETKEVSAEDLAEIERLRAEVEGLKEDKEKAERKAEVANEEAIWALGEKTKEEKRAERNKRSIENALTLGTVTAFNPEYGFLTFRPAIERPFNPGEDLAVRRQSGILARINVTRSDAGGVIADVRPNALAEGMPPIKAGDEIILVPDYYDPPADLDSPPSGGNPSPTPPASTPPAEIPTTPA